MVRLRDEQFSELRTTAACVAQESNELFLAAVACVAGRAYLYAPPLFAASLAAAAVELQLAAPLPAFVFRWLALVDSIMLSKQAI